MFKGYDWNQKGGGYRCWHHGRKYYCRTYRQELSCFTKRIEWDLFLRVFRLSIRFWIRALKKAKISPDDAKRQRDLITGTLDYSKFQDIDLVIEAVPETVEIKKICFIWHRQKLPLHYNHRLKHFVDVYKPIRLLFRTSWQNYRYAFFQPSPLDETGWSNSWLIDR